MVSLQNISFSDLVLSARDPKARFFIRDGNLFLDDNTREQRNRIIYDGDL